MNRSSPSSIWLARYAKLVVLMTFALIVIGSHTTTAGAGMAFPDWPLSHGSINPDGWWANVLQRLEHGHRLTAEMVALMIGALCAWVWHSKWSLPVAITLSLFLAIAATLFGASRAIVAHVGLWSAAVAFAMVIVLTRSRSDADAGHAVRWLAFAAFLGVCAQAALGGFRVTSESGGNPGAASAFRIVHGCFAQLELCLLVAIAALLASGSQPLIAGNRLAGLARWGWITAALVYLQLMIGATMRHLGAGLAISTFPQARADGGWVPQTHGLFTDLNFAHTRLGALVVSIAVVVLALRAFTARNNRPAIRRVAILLVALTAAQIALGIFVVWQVRPPILTTLHVVNGAAVLATTVLLAVRAGQESEGTGDAPLPVHEAGLNEVGA